MDMELQRTTLEGYRLVYHTMLTQEETLESIVPDACPDISRIVSAAGRAFLKKKGAAEGTVSLSGTACVTVLYIPEGESMPRSLEIFIPFQCTRDQPQFHADCLIQASGGTVSADARTINPRKLMVRVGLGFQIKVFDREQTELCSDVSGGDAAALEKRFITGKRCVVQEVEEKPFSFSDVLRPPASKPEIDELLYYRPEVGTIDAKFIGRKLVLKGDIQLRILYRSGDSLIPAQFELPYSQIMDMGAGTEEGEPEVMIALQNMECRFQNGELEVTLDGLAQAVLRTQQAFTLIDDVYSTSLPLDTERSAYRICAMEERDSRREMARQLCKTDIPAKQVLDCCVSVGSFTGQTVEKGMEWTAQINANILYVSEDDALCSAGYTIPVSSALETPEGCGCSCQCRTVGEATAVPVTDGLEVRVEAEFQWNITREDQVQCVTAVRQGVLPSGEVMRPSVIVRQVGSGESLWDIAKSCGSTIRDICSANELASEDIPAGTLLLIPIRRS